VCKSHTHKVIVEYTIARKFVRKKISYE
jgi:hypothetical protein